LGWTQPSGVDWVDDPTRIGNCAMHSNQLIIISQLLRSFTLTNRDKTSFFDCHHRFLPTNHMYKKNKKDFFVGRVEKDVAPMCLYGEELHDVVSAYGDIGFGFQSGGQKFSGFDLSTTR